MKTLRQLAKGMGVPEGTNLGNRWQISLGVRYRQRLWGVGLPGLQSNFLMQKTKKNPVFPEATAVGCDSTETELGMVYRFPWPGFPWWTTLSNKSHSPPPISFLPLKTLHFLSHHQTWMDGSPFPADSVSLASPVDTEEHTRKDESSALCCLPPPHTTHICTWRSLAIDLTWNLTSLLRVLPSFHSFHDLKACTSQVLCWISY